MTPASLTTLSQIADLAAQLLAANATAEYRAKALQNVPAGYPEVLELIVLAVARRLEAAGQAKQVALKIGFEAAEEVRFAIGGGKIYIPKGDDMDADEQESGIYRQFNGRNYAELAAQNRISVQTVYNIVRRQRAKAARDKQEVLFAEQAEKGVPGGRV